MKTRKAIRMREKILNESIKLILRNGFNGTSIQSITDAANISKGAFYWHFKSKDELLNTIVDYYEDAFIDGIINNVKNAKGNFLQIIKYSHKYATEFAYANKDLCVGFLTIAAEMVGSGTEIEIKIMNIYKRYCNFLKELLELGKKESMIREDIDIDMAAHVINAIHNGTLLEWYINYNNMESSKFALAYREIIYKGILK